MPLEPITDSLLPSGKAQAASSLRKLDCSPLKITQQCVRQDGRGESSIESMLG